LNIFSDSATFISEKNIEMKFEIYQNQKSMVINFNSDKAQNAWIRIYDWLGRIILNDEFFLNSGLNSKIINKNIQGKGLFIVELLVGNERIAKKMLLY
jgi:hypothetical protein